MPPTDSATSTRRSVDASGRALPMTEAEARRHAEQAIRALDALDDMGDEQEQRETLETLARCLDEDRLSYRKRFR